MPERAAAADAEGLVEDVEVAIVLGAADAAVVAAVLDRPHGGERPEDVDLDQELAEARLVVELGHGAARVARRSRRAGACSRPALLPSWNCGRLCPFSSSHQVASISTGNLKTRGPPAAACACALLEAIRSGFCSPALEPCARVGLRSGPDGRSPGRSRRGRQVGPDAGEAHPALRRPGRWRSATSPGCPCRCCSPSRSKAPPTATSVRTASSTCARPAASASESIRGAARELARPRAARSRRRRWRARRLGVEGRGATAWLPPAGRRLRPRSRPRARAAAAIRRGAGAAHGTSGCGGVL